MYMTLGCKPKPVASWKRARVCALAPVLCALILSSAGDPRAQAPQTRPQILGIAHLAIRVSDLASAKRFYGGLLGCDELLPARSGSTAVFVVNDRQRLVLHEGLPADQDERLLHIAFEIGDVEGMRSYLASHGVTASETAADPEGGGRAIDAMDPDGHRVRLLQRDSATRSKQSAETDRRISRRILHGGFTVRDPAAADRFYKDVLGFSEIWRGGRTDEVTNWINMRAPDGTDYLEYMLVSGPVRRDQLGTLHHVALLVTDIQEALDTVRTRSDARNARATPQVGRNRRWQLNLYDPDGTRVELMEPWTIR